MMPKGVEHWTAKNGPKRFSLVRIPMMPKGVEHEVPEVIVVPAVM